MVRRSFTVSEGNVQYVVAGSYLQVHKEIKDFLSRRSNLGGSRFDATHVDIVLPEIPASAKMSEHSCFVSCLVADGVVVWMDVTLTAKRREGCPLGPSTASARICVAYPRGRTSSHVRLGAEQYCP